jgi:hypothetical protein
MEKLNANNSAVVYTTKKNSVKQLYDIHHMNDKHPPNKLEHDHYNKIKLTILHQNVRGVINKVD